MSGERSNSAAVEAEAAKRMVAARINLTYYQPFFGTVVLHLKFVPRWDIETMATDGFHCFYNPGYVMALSKLEIEGVQAHEGLHCALMHFVRMEKRNAYRWNVATDFAINRDLKAGNFHLPGDAIPLDPPEKGMRGHLYDPQFDGMTGEQIYNRLPHKEDGEAWDGGMIGEVMPGDPDPAKAADLAVTWEIRVRQAIAQADKHAGYVPGAIREMIDKLNNPLIDWREKMRGFVGSACARDVTWSRPSRRFEDAIIPSRPHDAVARILFMIDTSGSMLDPPTLTAGLSEGEGILTEGGVQCIQWACFDTRIASHGEIMAGQSFQQFEITGGGGTSFEQPMQWAAEQQGDIAAIVVFTDGATFHWGDDPGKPVLWVGALSDRKWIEKAPYGEVCLIDLESSP